MKKKLPSILVFICRLKPDRSSLHGHNVKFEIFLLSRTCVTKVSFHYVNVVFSQCIKTKFTLWQLFKHIFHPSSLFKICKIRHQRSYVFDECVCVCVGGGAQLYVTWYYCIVLWYMAGYYYLHSFMTLALPPIIINNPIYFRRQ